MTLGCQARPQKYSRPQWRNYKRKRNKPGSCWVQRKSSRSCPNRSGVQGAIGGDGKEGKHFSTWQSCKGSCRSVRAAQSLCTHKKTWGKLGAMVGITHRSDNTLTWQHNHPLPWVRGHPSTVLYRQLRCLGVPKEEPVLAQAPLVLRIGTDNI